MKTLILNLLFQGWPEMAALIFTAFAIVGYNASQKVILLYGLILSFLIWLVRIIQIPFGLHTLVGTLFLGLIIHKKAKVSLANCCYVAFFVIFLLACIETIINFTFKKMFGVTFVQQNWLWVIMGWPQIIVMFILGLIIKKWIRFWFLSKFKSRCTPHDE